MCKLAEEIDHVARSGVSMDVFGVSHTVELTMSQRLLCDNGVLHNMSVAAKIHRGTRIAGLDELHHLLLDVWESEFKVVHDDRKHLVALLVT